MIRIDCKEYGILPETDVTIALDRLLQRFPRDAHFVLERGNY